MGCDFLLQAIFPTQESNPRLLYCRQILYELSYQRSPKKVKVAQSFPTLCDPMDYTVHGVLQARILKWVAFSLQQWIFPTQELNWSLLHCRQILYELSYQGGLVRVIPPTYQNPRMLRVHYIK